MLLPTDSEYFEAIQHPLRCFRDDMLRRGKPALDSQGKPTVRSGNSADVYEIRCPAAHERWAVKCYKRDLTGLAQRYRALNEQLLGVDCPSLLQAEFLDPGICIRGRWVPAVKMRWFEGQPLNEYVAESIEQPQVLLHVADLWMYLAWQLRRVGVAHGDLQHKHVLIGRGPTGTLTLRLIDYDGVFVPALAGQTTEKPGHANYQHPQRLWQKLYDAEADRFPQLVIYTALRALAVRGPGLWQRFDIGSNLLFREQDFNDPSASALFQTLWRIPDPVIHALTGRLVLACQGNVADIPLLEEASQARPLTPEEEERIDGLLGNDELPPPEAFSLTVDEEPAAGEPAGEEISSSAGEKREPSDLPVVTAVDPAASPGLPCPPEQLATAIFDKAAHLPASPPLVAPPEPETEPLSGPYVNVYHLDAWMPEQIAVIKMKGFVRAEQAEVVESIPGLVRVHLLDRYSLRPESPAPGLLSWLGFSPSPHAQPLHVATLEMHLKNKETEFQKLLEVTVRIGPGPDAEPDSPGWKPYCDKLFCTLRGFLMGNAGNP
jgi:hypothetical protein